MKKSIYLLVIFFISALMSGCNKFIYAQNSQNDIYYGIFNRRDMIHADVKMYKINSSVTCDGMIFLNSPSRAITLKNDFVDAKMILSCSDKKLIDADLKMTKGNFDNPSGFGIDQLDNRYSFSTISKNEFFKNVKQNEIKLINDKNSYLFKY